MQNLSPQDWSNRICDDQMQQIAKFMRLCPGPCHSYPGPPTAIVLMMGMIAFAHKLNHYPKNSHC